PDSWAFSQSVFSSILWIQNDTTNKVDRRVPGALDIAFSVLDNNQIVPELLAQMNGTFPDQSRPHALRFRDKRLTSTTWRPFRALSMRSSHPPGTAISI